jgi:pyruvate,water dikinase
MRARTDERTTSIRMPMTDPDIIRWFADISADDVALVGGKNSSLGEMYRCLTPEGIPVPNGFAVTAQAYRQMLDDARLWPQLHALLDDVDQQDIAELSRRARAARDLVYRAGLPDGLRAAILDAYRELRREYGAKVSVAVRSSATAEDLPTASFAGQHETYLNVRGGEALLDACRHCFASVFTERAISYRIDNGFDHFTVALSIGIMKMVRADRATSGVMFTLDTESGFRDVVFITAAYGLGENIVQGTVEPDEFYVHKPTFKLGYRTVLRRSLGTKAIKMIYARGHGADTRNVATKKAQRTRYCISDDDVLALTDYAMRIEAHFSERAGHPVPMDIEWAKDGGDGALYIIQARPETVVSRRGTTQLETYRLTGSGRELVSGRAVGARIATGRARIINSADDLSAYVPGEVIVADKTTPDWGPAMKTAAAIVTNRGGRTCHAAIVAREMDIAAVVGTDNATRVIRDGDEVTVSCAEGAGGRVYAGAIPFTVEHTQLDDIASPATRIMINLANPDIAFKTRFIPNDGVGLARMEFIINDHIKVHPMALVHPDRIPSERVRRTLLRLTAGYPQPKDYLIERLSEGIGTIAAAFYPKPVIVRLSDFKSNEYANLLGGRWFEPAEENPMIGFRGAARYAHPAYADGFALECDALRRVRDAMGLTNVKVMVPFCRTIDEGKRVLECLAENGLRRGENELEIYVMCEIPNNVIQIDAFAKLFDGFSIGSNDLTQLTLGVDRDSDIVAFDFDERDPGVLEMLRLATVGAKRNGRHSGICGQAPSDYPEIAEFLVEIGIDSISVTPDTIIATTLLVLDAEKRLGRPPRANSSTRGIA